MTNLMKNVFNQNDTKAEKPKKILKVKNSRKQETVEDKELKVIKKLKSDNKGVRRYFKASKRQI